MDPTGNPIMDKTLWFKNKFLGHYHEIYSNSEFVEILFYLLLSYTW